jgi:DHA1 family tetracycline resistance protein-like MFS transporter
MNDSNEPAPAVAPAPNGKRQAAMPFIMLTVLIDMISIGLIIPVMPHLIGAFAGTQVATAHWNLIVSSCFAVANFIGSPIIGALSDRFGRRPALLLGFCGLAVSFYVTAMATQLWVLAVVRLFSGAMMSNMTVANAYVADITAPEDRAKRFGMLGAVFGLGFILGPVLGGLLGQHSLRLPFVVAGTMALVNLAYGVFVLPESLPVERRRPFEWRKANPVGALRTLRSLPGLGLLVAVFAFTFLAQFVTQQTWVLYTQFKFGWNSLQSGLSLGAVGVMAALVQGVLLGRFLKRFSVQRLGVLALISSSICYVLWGAATQGWMMYAVIFANVLGFMAGPAFQSIVSKAADPSMQGRVMGAVASISSLMAVIGPIVGNSLLIAVADFPKGDWRIGAPYYLCAVLQAGAAMLAVRQFRRAPVPAAAPAVS